MRFDFGAGPGHKQRKALNAPGDQLEFGHRDHAPPERVCARYRTCDQPCACSRSHQRSQIHYDRLVAAILEQGAFGSSQMGLCVASCPQSSQRIRHITRGARRAVENRRSCSNRRSQESRDARKPPMRSINPSPQTTILTKISAWLDCRNALDQAIISLRRSGNGAAPASMTRDVMYIDPTPWPCMSMTSFIIRHCRQMKRDTHNTGPMGWQTA